MVPVSLIHPHLLQVIVLVADLELQHFSELLAGVRVGHFDLADVFAEGNAAALTKHLRLVLDRVERAGFQVDGTALLLVRLQVARVSFLLGLVVFLVEVELVDLLLAVADALHSVQVAQLLHRVIVRLQLVSALTVVVEKVVFSWTLIDGLVVVVVMVMEWGLHSLSFGWVVVVS